MNDRSRGAAPSSATASDLPSPHAGAPALASRFLLEDGVVYLDTAAHGPRLRAVQSAAQAALDAGVAPWRLDMHAWQAAIARVRAGAAALLDGDDEAVALVPSAAYGLAIAARNVPLGAGEGVLVLEGQFPSNLLPWQQRCGEVGAHVVGARGGFGGGCGGSGGWTAAVLERLHADPSIRVLALPHVHWHDGEVLDLDAIADAAQSAGAALVLDLSQSLGARPVDLARWRPQFVVAVGHKWLLGAPGLAYLWAAPRWRERGVSIEQHWTAFDGGDAWHFPVDAMPPHSPGARRFDAGGVADPQRLAMAGAALAQVGAWGVPAIAAALAGRVARFAGELRGLGLGHWVTDAATSHFIGVRPPDRATLQFAARALSAAGVVATARAGCLRIAPHLHVDDAQMQRVAGILETVARGRQAGAR